ncbi:hypothetical protein FALB51S_01567 [Frigidibacter albus]
MASHRPEELFRLLELQVFLGREQPGADQLRHFLDIVQVLGDPVERLKVAQAALALLDVGFQHIALAALTAVAFGAFGQLGLDEFRPGAAEQLVAQPLVQFGRQPVVTGQEAVLQQGRADGDVLGAKAQAILHRAAGMADLQPHVPQHVEHGFDDAFGPAGDLPRGQEQQVHVGLRRHLGPAIAADGDHRQPLALGRVRQRVQVAGGDVEGGADDDIGKRCIGPHGGTGGAGMPGELSFDAGRAFAARRDQVLHRQRTRGHARRRVGQHGIQRRTQRRGIEAGRRAGLGKGGAGGGQCRVRTRRHRNFLGQGQSRKPGCCGPAPRQAPVRWCRQSAGGRSR